MNLFNLKSSLYFWRRWKFFFCRKIEQLFFNQYFYWIFSKIDLRYYVKPNIIPSCWNNFYNIHYQKGMYWISWFFMSVCDDPTTNKRFLNKEIVKTFSKSLKGIINSTRSIEKRSVVYKINCRGTVITWSNQRDLPHDFSFCC